MGKSPNISFFMVRPEETTSKLETQQTATQVMFRNEHEGRESNRAGEQRELPGKQAWTAQAREGAVTMPLKRPSSASDYTSHSRRDVATPHASGIGAAGTVGCVCVSDWTARGAPPHPPQATRLGHHPFWALGSGQLSLRGTLPSAPRLPLPG